MKILNHPMKKPRMVLLLFLILISYSNQAQTVKRQCVSSFGITSTCNNIVLMQTAGQPYGTIVSSEPMFIGFQQPITYEVDLANINLISNLAINIYPNPATFSFTIQSIKPIENVTIKVTDLGGRLIYTNSIPTLQAYSIDCTTWSSGIYIITAIDQNFHKNSSKLIISK